MATYIRSDIYDSIVSAITSLGHDQDAAKIALGEIGDVWPCRIASDVLQALHDDLEVRQGRLRTQGESQAAIRGFSAPE